MRGRFTSGPGAFARDTWRLRGCWTVGLLLIVFPDRVSECSAEVNLPDVVVLRFLGDMRAYFASGTP